MKLSGLYGVSFILEVDGYEFPQLMAHDEDSNWLMVRGQVTYPGGGWSFCHSCLTTDDLRVLAGWLDCVSAGTPTVAMCWFDEPNLVFEYRSVPSPAVVVHFAHDSAPTWHGSDERIGHFEVSFDVALNDISGAASDLRASLTMFPRRVRRCHRGETLVR
jgi:hypothetical protein